jgi:topoisomerase-4 subunit A
MDKRVSFISESAGSYMDIVSTAYRPEAKIVYNKLLKETKNLPDNIVNLADLIDVKGMKAQGNQMTKLKVKEIVLTHPIDESPEPWPELKVNTEVGEDADTEILEEDDDEGPTPSMEWDLTKKEEEDNEDQIKLF